MRKLITLALLVFFCFPAGSRVIYVNVAATGMNNGSSWANAYTTLTSALAATKSDTIWVANGTYRALHVVRDSIKLFGGFTGTETSLAQRTPGSYLTILDGDVGTIGSKFDNDRVVVLAKSAVATGMDCIVDGFKIVNGYSSNATDVGGGLCVDQGSFPTVKIVIANCLFANNESAVGGGAIGIMSRGVTTITNCRFENNMTGTAGAGGAISKGMGLNLALNVAGPVYVSDCVFRNNSAPLGGAVYAKDTSITSFTRCVFMGNSATQGGAVYTCRAANVQVYNSLIAGNKATIGAAHYSDSSTTYRPLRFIHCTVAGNLSSGTFSPNHVIWLRGAGDVLRNSIIWGNTSAGAGLPNVANPAAGATYQSNVIQGGAGLTGTGTYVFNPMFISPGSAAAAPFPATATFDYHLSAHSLAIDTGTNAGLIAPYNLDLDSNARIQGRRPDLGAYEWKTCPWHNVSISGGPTDFCAPGSVRLTASGNPIYNHNYQWNGGAQTGPSITVTAGGVNRVVVVDSLGCRAEASVMVNAVAAPVPVITYTSGNTLGVSGTYATYQWYLNGSPIAGATGATFHPTSTGNYSVKVTTVIAGCSGTSAIYNLTKLAAGSTSVNDEVRIYPNPTRGHLSVSIVTGRALSDITISVRSLTGQEVYYRRYAEAGNLFSASLDLHSVAKGVYFLVVSVVGAQIVKRVVIE